MSSTRTIVLLALGGLACAGGAAEQPPEDPLRPVRVAMVVDTAVARPVSGTGVLAARDELELGFKIGGVIAAVRVDAGDRVRRGQVLATLERTEIDAGVAKARSALAKAERDAERYGRLHRDSVITLAQYQDATTALELARAELRAVEFDRRYAEITAPADGVVLARLASPGELVSPGSAVLRVASGRRGMVLRVGLSDRDVVRIALGDSASVRFDAVPERRFTGLVEEIGAAAAPGTGTYPVEIRLPQAAELPTGLVGHVAIAPGDARPVRLVPIEALVEADGDRGTVFVLGDQGRRAERREVAIAFTDGRRVAVAAGLDGDARVVTEGGAYLDDREAVRVLP